MTALSRRTVLGVLGAVLAAPLSAAQGAPEFLAYERDTGGRIGVYAQNLTTGQVLAWREHERFVMCSSFKASLAAHILTRVDKGLDRLEDVIHYGSADIPDADWYAPVARENLAKGALSVGEMCAAAVEYSDNTCANLLLARVGGPAALTRFWRSLGDRITRLDHNELALNRSPPGDPHDTSTPYAMAGNLRRFVLGTVLAPGSRDLFIDWLVGCKTGDNRLRGGLHKDWKIGDKTGNNGSDAAADIAVVWPSADRPIVICVYTQGGSPTPYQLTSIFAEVGRHIATSLA